MRRVALALLIGLLLLAAAGATQPTIAAPPGAPPTMLHLADVNRDGMVNLLDLVAVSAAYRSADPAADINADGEVDLLDLVAVATAFGQGAQVWPTPLPTERPPTEVPTAMPTATNPPRQPTPAPTATRVPPQPTAMSAATLVPNPDPWCIEMRIHLVSLEQEHRTRMWDLVGRRDARAMLEETAWYNRVHGEAVALYNLYCGQ